VTGSMKCLLTPVLYLPVGVIGLVQPEKQPVYLVCMMRSSELAIFQLNVGIRMQSTRMIRNTFSGLSESWKGWRLIYW